METIEGSPNRRARTEAKRYNNRARTFATEMPRMLCVAFRYYLRWPQLFDAGATICPLKVNVKFVCANRVVHYVSLALIIPRLYPHPGREGHCSRRRVSRHSQSSSICMYETCVYPDVVLGLKASLCSRHSSKPLAPRRFRLMRNTGREPQPPPPRRLFFFPIPRVGKSPPLSPRPIIHNNTVYGDSKSKQRGPLNRQICLILSGFTFAHLV